MGLFIGLISENGLALCKGRMAWVRSAKGPVDQLDRVENRDICARCKLGCAADISCRDKLRTEDADV